MATLQLLIIFVIFALIVTITLGFPTLINANDSDDSENLTTKEKRELANNNRLYSERFICAPRPRSFHSADLFNDASMEIYPNCYVLHRCDSQSGCCTEPHHVCEVHKMENVSLMFIFNNKLTNKRGYKSKIVSNHTECECKSLNSTGLPPIVNSLDVLQTNDARKSKSLLFMFVFILKLIYFYI